MSGENLQGGKGTGPRRGYDGASSRRAGVRSEYWQAQQNRAAQRRKAQAEKLEEPAVSVETVVDPTAPITVTKGEIQLGQAFLRDARKTVAIRRVSLQQVVAEMEFPYKRLLCTRVGGAEILVARAGREMDDLESIEVVKEVGPDGITREFLKCNFTPTPKNSGQVFLDGFRKGL